MTLNLLPKRAVSLPFLAENKRVCVLGGSKTHTHTHTHTHLWLKKQLVSLPWMDFWDKMGQARYLVFDYRDWVAYLSSHHPYGLMHMHALRTGTPKNGIFFCVCVCACYPRFTDLWRRPVAATSCLLTPLKGSCDNEFRRGRGRRGVVQETHSAL